MQLTHLISIRNISTFLLSTIIWIFLYSSYIQVWVWIEYIQIHIRIQIYQNFIFYTYTRNHIYLNRIKPVYKDPDNPQPADDENLLRRSRTAKRMMCVPKLGNCFCRSVNKGSRYEGHWEGDRIRAYCDIKRLREKGEEEEKRKD